MHKAEYGLNELFNDYKIYLPNGLIKITNAVL